MEHVVNRRAFYDTFTSLKGCGQFSLADLRNLFGQGNDNRSWNDSLQLLALISNLSLGRPMLPDLVDAVVAQSRRDELSEYVFRIPTLEEEDSRGWRTAVIEVLDHKRGVFGSFQVSIVAPCTQEDWYIKEIRNYGLKVFTIVEKRNRPGAEYASTYTIFDNLHQSVEQVECGSDYLQCLAEQIEMFDGEDMRDLFYKFLGYADVMLSSPAANRLEISYKPAGSDRVHLRVAVTHMGDEKTHRSRNEVIVAFDEILKKGYR